MKNSMIRNYFTCFIFCVITFTQVAYAQTDQTTVKKAHVFAKGVISTGHEFTVTFTPDGKRVYFTRGFPKQRVYHIMYSDFKNGVWQPPVRVSFSDEGWSDLDPALSPDGQNLFFISTRPLPGTNSTRNDMDIWVIKREGDHWETPHPVTIVNSPAKEGSPTVSNDGTLCFFSDRNAKANQNAIYCSELNGNSYSKSYKLKINSDSSDTSPHLSPDGKILLFYSTRSGGFGKADLYYSIKKGGKWSEHENLGSLVNTDAWEYNPTVSPDGKTLYFGRNQMVYQVPVKLLNIPALNSEHFKY